MGLRRTPPSKAQTLIYNTQHASHTGSYWQMATYSADTAIARYATLCIILQLPVLHQLYHWFLVKVYCLLCLGHMPPPLSLVSQRQVVSVLGLIPRPGSEWEARPSSDPVVTLASCYTYEGRMTLSLTPLLFSKRRILGMLNHPGMCQPLYSNIQGHVPDLAVLFGVLFPN